MDIRALRDVWIMKKMACLLVATLTLIALLFLVSSVQAYTNSENGFSINPPVGWTTEEEVEGVVVAFLGPQDPDVGYVNVNVDVQETYQTLETIVENTKQSWAASYSNYSLITDESWVLNGDNCHELEISYEDDGTFIQDSVLFVENDVLYQVTYLAGPTNYDAYFEDWAESINTFEIQSAQPTSTPDGFSFRFELTGLPFLLLLVAIAVIIVVIIAVLSRRSKAESSRTFPSPPPPPPAQ